MRVLGIDPGLRNMGWGIIDVKGNKLTHIANGVCKSQGEDLATRLLCLFDQMEQTRTRICMSKLLNCLVDQY